MIYPYLTAVLPTLTPGEAPELTPEQFDDLAAANLAARDLARLAAGELSAQRAMRRFRDYLAYRAAQFEQDVPAGLLQSGEGLRVQCGVGFFRVGLHRGGGPGGGGADGVGLGVGGGDDPGFFRLGFLNAVLIDLFQKALKFFRHKIIPSLLSTPVERRNIIII